jgi:crotonobetainyl-CoA:carnitine CoA-transferase CaiB-like acyl-CoA transferase
MLLAPYRVLDLSDERGQLAGQMLAQMGAEVILVEPPEGTRTRCLAPFAGDTPGPDRSLVWKAYNRGKKSVVLDTAGNAGDRTRLRNLVATVDVLIESGGPGHLASLGLDADTLAAVNPGLVVVSISAFGATGPKADWAATDLTVWAAAGPLSLAGDDGRPPVPVGVPQAFAHAAAEAAGAAIVALMERRRSGLGQHIDVSAQQASAQATQCAILATPNGASTHFRSTGGIKLGELHIQLLWPCADGHVSITFLFGSAIGVYSRRFMEWIHEEGFCDQATLDKDWVGYTVLLVTHEEPVSEYERVKQIIEDFCMTKTKAELLDAALKRGLLIAPVLTPEDVVESPQFAARGYFDEIDGVRYPGQFCVFSETPRIVLNAAPILGAHTESILAALPAASPSRPAPTGAPVRGRALDGLKVLDLMWVMAGPAGSRVLADHGATVVRVESAKHVETARTLQPFKNDEAGAERSSLFASLNAGKLGIAVDIKTDEGRHVILDLVRWADVVLESFSPKAMPNWGLDYATLREVNPRIVMMSSCLFGQTGPLSNLAGYGTMASALTGFTGVTGWADLAPCGPYGAYTDYIAPRFANAALFAAIDHQQRTGKGQYIDFSQAEGALHTLAPAVLDYSVNGRGWARNGTDDPNHEPHGVFLSCREGQWIAIACGTDAQRSALATLVGGLDPASIAAWTALHLPDAATALLQGVGVPCHPVQNSPECIHDPQLLHRGHFLTLPHAEMGEVTIEAPRAVFSATPALVTAPGPGIGEHTYTVLTEVLGYDDERFADLLVAGALE